MSEVSATNYIVLSVSAPNSVPRPSLCLTMRGSILQTHLWSDLSSGAMGTKAEMYEENNTINGYQEDNWLVVHTFVMRSHGE
jgi:hypothetical protein